MRNVRTWKTAFITGAIIALAATTVACNNNSVVISSGGDSPIGKSFETGTTNQLQMDILWVIDDSASMAEEQYQIIANFKNFIQTLKDNKIDAHIAVTSTNSTRGGYGVGAKRSLNSGKFFDKTYGEFTSIAFKNMSDSVFANFYKTAWKCAGVTKDDNDAKTAYKAIQLAIQQTDSHHPDLGSNKIKAEFPATPGNTVTTTGYLSTSDYDHDTDGELTSKGMDKLSNDFTCIALVGLGGNFVEEGIGAALNAIDPNGPNKTQLTGTNGFIRPNAKFALIIASDENDCSMPDKYKFNDPGTGNPIEWDVTKVCPALCELFNAKGALPPGIPNLLYDPKTSAQKLLKYLSDLKKKPVTKDDVIAVSIGGPNIPETTQTLPLNFTPPDWSLFTTENLKTAKSNIYKAIIQPDIQSGGASCNQPAGAPNSGTIKTFGPILGDSGVPSTNAEACKGNFGSATSSNRYVQFVSNFGYSYPPDISSPPAQVKKNALICGADFAPLWDILSSLIKKSITLQCIDVKDLKGACGGKAVNESCEGGGTCQKIPGSSDLYCSSLVQIVLSAPDEATGNKLKSATVGTTSVPYCVKDSYGSLSGEPYSCILNPATYDYKPCVGGMRFVYKDLQEAQKALGGIKTEIRYTSLD